MKHLVLFECHLSRCIFYQRHFLLFDLKFLGGKVFWYNLRLPEKNVYNQAIKVERLMKKVERREFVRWENINNQPFKKKRDTTDES